MTNLAVADPADRRPPGRGAARCGGSTWPSGPPWTAEPAAPRSRADRALACRGESPAHRVVVCRTM